jgi:hypothetical protein
VTEEEWATTSDTWRMLQAVQGAGAPDRKAWLLNVALCHLFWRYLPAVSRAVVGESERLADGLADVGPEELCRRANTAVPPRRPGPQSPRREAITAVCYGVLPGELFVPASACQAIDPADARPAALIRDVFGYPSRRVTMSPDWRTPTVLSLARAAYDDRPLPGAPLDNGRLAVLADALEEAGCSDDELLGHLRPPDPHVRGCWALDLILGKG